MFTSRNLSLIVLMCILYVPSARAAQHNNFSDNILVPSVLRDYDNDALFATVLINQLAHKNPKIATIESFWISNSTRHEIERVINNAPISDNSDTHDDLVQALKQTHTIMHGGKIYLPRAYVWQRLWALRFDVANFKTLQHIDGYQELKLQNPQRHALLAAVPSLDKLYADVVQEFEKIETKEIA